MPDRQDTHRGNSLNLVAIPVLLAAFLTVPGTALAAAAGRAVFTSGAPQAVDQAGAARTLKRGDDVFSGDQLSTPNGARLQVSFADGAYISLQPDSEYAIEQYQFSGQQDGTERASYRLLKGGVRALTGLVGKKNPDAYKVQTPVATIGIRGTGHNTRICQGDCPGKTDGLYHNTWEGTTFVVNDVDSADVPTGSGVFVAGIDKPIEFLDQPPGVTAIDTGTTREEEQEEEEERTAAFLVGEQRTDEGDQVIVPSESSTVVTGLRAVGVNQDSDSPGEVDTINAQEASLFVRDSDGVVVGILLLEEEDDAFGGGSLELSLGTIDPDAVRGGNNAELVNVAGSLLATADPQLVALLQEKPAVVADQFISDGIGWLRFTDGRILVTHESDDAEIKELVGNQSVHFIFGPPPPSLPTAGFAFYEFMGGTRSTSLSGATIGEGAVEGEISVDFGRSEAFLSMKVDHASLEYLVQGLLNVNTAGDNDIFDHQVFAFTSVPTPDSACYPQCPVLLDGGFAGPAVSGGFPEFVGFEYEIYEHDPIIGVAGFQFGGSQSPTGP